MLRQSIAPFRKSALRVWRSCSGEVTAQRLEEANRFQRSNSLSMFAAGFVGAFGGGVFYAKFHTPPATPTGDQANSSSEKEATPEWDYNWDGRQVTYNKKLGERRIILVRHGKYVVTGERDDQCRLDDLGKSQARETAVRLTEEGIKFDRIVSSTLTRARETAEIIKAGLDFDGELSYDELLAEGPPAKTIPRSKRLEESGFFDNLDTEGPRIHQGFKKYMTRCETKADETVLLVCHGNVIRSFVCRALQFPVEAWLRLCTDHCGITEFRIQADGKVSLRRFGDSGHLAQKTA